MIGLGSCIGLALIDIEGRRRRPGSRRAARGTGRRRAAGQVRRPRRTRAAAPCSRASGANRRRLLAVLVGGARMFALGSIGDIGARNAIAVRSRAEERRHPSPQRGHRRQSRAHRPDHDRADDDRRSSPAASARTLLDFGRPRRMIARPRGQRRDSLEPSCERPAEPRSDRRAVRSGQAGRRARRRRPRHGRRGHRLRTVDFSRPTKFTNDHQRRISRAIDTFNGTAATRLSAELRAQIELETINTTQLTWSAAQSQLRPARVAVTLEVNPIGTRMMLTAEQPLVLSAIECLLGGIADRPPKERRFSDIDWTLTQRFVESLVNQLSIVWQDLGGLTPVDRGDGSAPRVEPGRGRERADLRRDDRVPDEQAVLRTGADDPVGRDRDRVGPDRRPRGARTTPRSCARRASDARWRSHRSRCAPRSRPARSRSRRSSRSPPAASSRSVRCADQGVSLFAENVKLGRAHPGCNGSPPRRPDPRLGGELIHGPRRDRRSRRR